LKDRHEKFVTRPVALRRLPDPFVGCEKKTASEQVKDTAQEVKDGVKNAADKTGDAVKDAAQDAKDTTHKAAEKVEDATN